MNNYSLFANEIRSRISMKDVLEQYGIAHNGIARGDKGRIPCPIHNGKDKNFSYKRKYCYCFVCNFHGNVIDFTMAYFNLPFREAVAKLNADFFLGLPVGEQLDADREKEIRRAAFQRRKEADRKRKEHERLYNAYQTALETWIGMDIAMREKASQSVLDPLNDDYAYAAIHIDEASYRLDLAMIALAEFERAEK